MTPRQIHSLVRRFFYGEPPGEDAWTHLFVNDKLNHEASLKLLLRYIDTSEVIVHGGSVSRSILVPISEAARKVEEFLRDGPVRIASTDFRGQVLVTQVGVGRGGRNA